MADLYDAPESLAAVASSSSTIALSWTTTETASIEIQRKQSGGLYSVIDTVAGTTTSYSDTTCSAGTRYYYRIRHSDGGETSEWSNEDDDYTYPATPTGLAVSYSGKTATLTWTNGGTYTYIGVYHKASSSGTWTTDTATLTGTLATTTVTVAAESTSYDFRIRGYSSTSTYWSAYETESDQTSGVMAPSTLLLTSASTTSITATWTDNSSVEDGYEVYYIKTADIVTGGESDYELFETTAADAATSTVTGLDEDTDYTIRVRAKDGTAYSSYILDNVTTGAVPDADPVAVDVTVVSQTALTFAWTCTASNESGFTVLRSTDDATYTEIGTAVANATSYADTGLDSYTTYYYKVRAYNDYGVSALSSSANGTTTIDLDPPTGLYAEALSSTQIKLTFTVNAGDATNHYIERKTTGSFSALGSVGDGTTTTYTDGTCSAATLYTYRIRAYNSVAVSYGDYSAEIGKETLSVGTDTVRRNESYFAMGNILCVASETPQNSIAAYWTSKPLDFGEFGPEDSDKFKTVDLVQLEYTDHYSSVPIVVSLSNNGGVTWFTSTQSIGIGDGADHISHFHFAGVTGKNITLKVSSTDTDTTFCWTGIIIHYTVRGQYFDVSQPATSWDGGEFGTVQLYTIDGGGF